MAVTYAVGLPIIYSVAALILLLFGAIIYFILNWNRGTKKDLALFITDKGWRPVWTTLQKKKSFTWNKGLFILDPEAAKINSKGKLLFIFNEGYSAPLIIKNKEQSKK